MITLEIFWLLDIMLTEIYNELDINELLKELRQRKKLKEEEEREQMRREREGVWEVRRVARKKMKKKNRIEEVCVRVTKQSLWGFTEFIIFRKT